MTPNRVESTVSTTIPESSSACLEAAMAIENRNQIMASRTEDFAEGMKAFLEKRKPVYRNR